MTTRLVRAELYHVDRQTDGRTDMTKLIAPFRNSANRPFFLARTVYNLRQATQETRDPTLAVKVKAVLSSRGLHVFGLN
jgi:hypothetical protein